MTAGTQGRVCTFDSLKLEGSYAGGLTAVEKQCGFSSKCRLFVQTLPFKVSLQGSRVSINSGFGRNVESQGPTRTWVAAQPFAF